MSTLTTYVSALDVKGFDALSTAVKQEAVQEARRRVYLARRWSWLESSAASLVTVANVATVSLTSLTTLAHIDAVRLSDASGLLPLNWRPYSIIRDLQDRYASTGTPEFWTRRGTNLVFYPTPSRVFTVTVEFALAAADLAASPAVCPIPDKNRDLVTWAASVPLAYRQRDFQASSAADQYFVKVLLPLHGGQDSVEQRQTSNQVRSGYWGD
jgi:hypothetical protein